MNTLLILGILLIVGYGVGLLLRKAGFPAIIGYILTGMALSPKNVGFIAPGIIEDTMPVLEICLAFIAFEVGGSLKWSKIKKHEKEIISITVLASIFPLILISTGVFCIGWIFPDLIKLDLKGLALFSILLGSLASPTAPAATLAVIHAFKARGKVTSTILGVAALDDVFGIILFSLTIAITYMIGGNIEGNISGVIFSGLYQIFLAILTGGIAGILMGPLTRLFGISREGQWVVILFSLILLCAGFSLWLDLDPLLSAMTMGVIVVNLNKQHKIIFRILERYTEDLIFLFFFLLSGMHLDIHSLPQAAAIIALFVVLRGVGKWGGAYFGAKWAGADPLIQKYTAGGLLPQAGIVIGLVLSVYQEPGFRPFSDLLLATIMGTTIIYELIGPFAAQWALKKAGEIKA